MMAPAHLAVVAAKKRSGGGGGAWYESLAGGDVTVGVAIVTGAVRNSPVTLSAGNVTKLGVYKFTNSAKSFRVGLYNASDRSLVVQGVVPGTGTGWNEVSVSSTAVAAGSYLLAVNAVTDGDQIGYSTTISVRMVKNATYNPLPDPLPANDAGPSTGAIALRAWVE